MTQMSDRRNAHTPAPVTRRTFLGTSAAAAAFAWSGGLRVFGSDVIRLGLIGCGGRGTGAVSDCLRGTEGVELVAMGDLAPDRLAQCQTELEKFAASNPALAPRIKVTPDRTFTGFDAYQKVLAADVDLVILATPPAYRAAHLAAAVDAGKHIFAEKPVAVDPAGVRSVLQTYDRAKAKNLAIGVGTQRRHQADYRETIERIHGGAIGKVLTGQVFWNQGGLWSRDRKPEWTDAEWQIRNWLYFTWLSGDHIVEQHVHNLDVAYWVLNELPIKATGVGGRQFRTDPKYGHIYDHFAVDYEYASGARILSMCRQIPGTSNRVGEWFIGTEGQSDASRRIAGAKAWTYTPPAQRSNGFVQEHTDLVASIRSGSPYNELKQIAESSLVAIMGREAAYTGQEMTWDGVLNAQQDLTPPISGYGPMTVPPIPMPGRTRLERGWAD
ncbi:MAG TPA: Gfo/Idh/MocA family oxidoreductase [Vicinamibacterales bacterium]|nr:Gfo/Idh/MocA family oxidoreductase [Vicinamibacterales bacterium]